MPIGNLQTPNLRLEINYQCKPAEGEDRKRTICIQKETGNCDADVPEDYSRVHPVEGEIIDLTPQVAAAVRESAVREGLVHLFVSTRPLRLPRLSIEPGALADLARALSVLAPDDAEYAHNTKWGDGNGRSHVKAALVGPSLTVPVAGGGLCCGTWQQIVLLELDANAGREEHGDLYRNR